MTGDLEVERLIGLGASLKDDVKMGSLRWTTQLDPEGNEFDVIAERRISARPRATIRLSWGRRPASCLLRNSRRPAPAKGLVSTGRHPIGRIRCLKLQRARQPPRRAARYCAVARYWLALWHAFGANLEVAKSPSQLGFLQRRPIDSRKPTGA
jgi:hypothetical protein